MTSLLLPTKDRNLTGASLIPGAVLEAVEFLEIDRPVEVKWAAGLRRAGCHRSRNGVHVITVSTYLEADALSKTLWHELVHAAQEERYESRAGFNAAYGLQNRLYGYRRNRFEAEAEEWSEDFHAELRLAK